MSFPLSSPSPRSKTPVVVFFGSHIASHRIGGVEPSPPTPQWLFSLSPAPDVSSVDSTDGHPSRCFSNPSGNRPYIISSPPVPTEMASQDDDLPFLLVKLVATIFRGGGFEWYGWDVIHRGRVRLVVIGSQEVVVVNLPRPASSFLGCRRLGTKHKQTKLGKRKTKPP